MALSMQFSFAQEKTITGKVTEEGLPIPGVNVVVKGTTRSTQTDFDGNFAIKASAGEVLEFMFVGMKTKVVTVGASSAVNVIMETDAYELSGVVVEGYRQTTKTKSNIASTTINAESIEGRPNASFVQTLQAQIPGLSISTGSGQPGSSSTIILRGVGSINGSIEPLFVIDGVPQNGDIFRSLNPNEIQSVSVLKDAGATSIYGNRGANGVIVVKTKMGKFNTGLNFTYVATTGVSEMQSHKYNMMSAQELLSIEKVRGIGMGASMSQSEIDAYSVNTDWSDVFFRTGVQQSHTLSISGGGENLASFTSLGYSETQGILINTDLQKFNFRNNVTGKTNNGKFSYGSNININFSKRNEGSNIGTSDVNQNYVLGALISAPYVDKGLYTTSSDLSDLYESNGTLLYTPLMLMDKAKYFKYTTDELKAIASLNGMYKITDDLSVLSTLGVDYRHDVTNMFDPANTFNSNLFVADGQIGGSDQNVNTRVLLANVNAQLRYQKTFAEKHTIEGSVFTEYFKAHYRTFGFLKRGLDPKTGTPGNDTGYVPFDSANPSWYLPTVSASVINAGLFSYFGQVDYDYDSRFGFSGTLRRDASYRFNTTNKWGTFWSVAGRWNIDKESFMENSVFDVLKLRASYGTTGNQNISGESMFNLPSASRSLYGSATGYANQLGYGVLTLGNDALKWETIYQGNIGLDFELFNHKLRGSIDVYEKTTKDLYQPIRISAVNAITSINANFGDLRNRGAELLLSYDVIKNDNLSLSLNFNGAYNKNEVTTMPEENSWDGSSLTTNFVGDLLNQFYVIPYAGVNRLNGNLLFLDTQGNYTETPDLTTDRRKTGKSAIPVYHGGFGFDLDYKGFFLSTLFSYVGDIYRMDWDYEGLMDAPNIGQFNLSADVLNYWTPTNTVTSIPSLTASNLATDDYSDRFLYDASYVRLRNVSFGYNFPKKMLGESFSSLKLFVQGENLHTWSKWKGWDAESTRGADVNAYPTPKMVTFGVEVKF
jgi:TonB-linked SusC/RagA family outer membrane protein